MLEPVGVVKSQVHQQMDEGWGDQICDIVFRPELADGLKGIEEFSHLIILTQLHQAAFSPEKHLVRKPQGRTDMPKVGIFAQRGKNRPNTIGVTTVELLKVKGNILRVKGLDAIDGTPVLDVKPYFPQYDQRIGVKVPEWVDLLMEDYF